MVDTLKDIECTSHLEEDDYVNFTGDVNLLVLSIEVIQHQSQIVVVINN